VRVRHVFEVNSERGIAMKNLGHTRKGNHMWLNDDGDDEPRSWQPQPVIGQRYFTLDTPSLRSVNV
jgi:hypothetical protein